MASTFVRTNSEVWSNKTEEQKNEYKDSIVFIENTGQIWSNGIYYNSNSDIEIPDTLPNPVPLTITVNDPNAGQYTWMYDGTEDPNIVIDLSNASSGGGNIFETVAMESAIDGLTFTRTEMGWILDSDYLGHTVYIPTTSDMEDWNNKQDLLVSGTNIKTINNQSLLGSGNIEISAGSQSDTKNTAGATDSSSLLYLIGAPSQEENPQTYSSNSCYISDGKLYSDNTEVLTQKIDDINKPIQFCSQMDGGAPSNNESYSAHSIVYNSFSADIYPDPLVISQPYTIIDMMSGDFSLQELTILLNSQYRVNTNYNDSVLSNDQYSSYIEIYLNETATHALRGLGFGTANTDAEFGEAYSVDSIQMHLHIYDNQAGNIINVPCSSSLYGGYYFDDNEINTSGFMASKSILKIHCCYKPAMFKVGYFEIVCHQYVY